MQAVSSATPPSSRSSDPLILLCHSDARGGLELNILKTARKLQEAGVPVLLLLKPHSPLEQWAKDHGLPHQHLLIRNKRLDVLAAYHLAQIMKRTQSRQLITAISQHNYIAAYAKAFFKSDMEVYYYQQMQLGQPKKGWLQNYVHRRLNKWIAPLPYLEKQALEWTKLKPEQLAQIPLGVDVQRFAPKPQGAFPLRAHFHLPDEAIVCGMPGRFDPHKNQLLVLQAFLQIHQDYPEVYLLFVGEETLNNPQGYKQQIHYFIRQHGLEDRVLLLPFQEHIERIYWNLDLFIMATSKETYGAVSAEAMAAGVPIIGARGGGTPELVGEHAYLFTPNDPSSLAQQWKKALESPRDRAERAKAAQKRVREKFGFQQVIPLFKQLLGRI